MKNKIKTFEEACEVLKIETSLPDVSMLPKEEQLPIIAHYKLTVITRALNEGWEPDWDNSNETKYHLWFNMSSSGFSYVGCAYAVSVSVVGSRLCFETEDQAIYAGEQFTELYKEYFLIK